MPSDHPLRVVKRLADQALKALSPDLDRMYAKCGPAVDPAGAVAEVFIADCPVLGAQ